MTNALLVSCAMMVLALHARAQSGVVPNNDKPNPYRTIEGWAKMPEGRPWGSTSAVDIDADGKSIWVAERCGANSCVGSNLPTVLEFDRDGTLLRSFGAGLMLTPHGIHVDRSGNVWVTDCACTGARGAPRDSSVAPKGHQIFKFSPTGTLLMTLGKAGGDRDSSLFWQPNNVVVAANGDFFVVEGHSSMPGSVARILKFRSDGTLIKMWGSFGNGPDQLDQPHTIAMDSRGRLFVGDRGNNRIVIYDQSGKRLDTWYQFSRPSGIAIDAHDRIYVTDSESGSVAKQRTDWKRGIRIGSAKDGTVTAFIPDPAETPSNTSAAEGVAVDAAGNVYGAEVGPKALKRYVIAKP
ncbi:MAG: peptidyl-alpha-hydroxyglycine alpha-amidating lyase family protein [bacterium]